MPLDREQIAALIAGGNHADLYMARSRAAPEQQDQLAGAEHRAFAREATAENPALALPIALASILYQPYKMLDGKSRSNPSLDQAMQGVAGVGEGLSAYGAQKLQAIQNIFREIQSPSDTNAQGDNPGKKV